jgi:Tfp pilus assembly protein PilF
MANKAQVDDRRDWLLKASAKVLGPYAGKDIIDLLKNQAVTGMDEVRRSDRRWQAIREVKEFIPTLQALKFENDSSELTQTIATTPGSSTKTERISQIKDDMTPPPVIEIPVQQPAEIFRKTPMKDVTPVRESNGSERPAHLTGKAFGLQNDLRLEKEIEKKANSWRWVIIALVIFVFGVIGGVQVYYGQKKTGDYEKKIRAALRYKSLQLFEQSLVEYKKTLLVKEPDLSIQAQMAPLIIAVDGETVKGRRILEKAIVMPGRPRAQMADDYAGIGLSFLIQGDLKEAEESFSKALSFDRTHLAANLNLAWIKFSRRDYPEALKLLANIQVTGQPILSVAEAMVALEGATQMKITGLISPAVARLELSIRNSQNLKAEQILLLISLMQIQIGQDSSLWMRRFLEEPQRSQRYFVQEPLITKKWIEGPHWEKYCNDLQVRRLNANLVRMTRAACFLNIGKDEDAKRLIDEAMKQNPKDSIALLMQLSLFVRSNRLSEAQTIAQSAELKDFRGPLWITGKLCLETGDLGCAQNAFRAILEKNPVDIYARGGLAAVHHQLGQKTEAHKMINLGLNDEPLYLPLLQLRDVMESQR